MHICKTSFHAAHQRAPLQGLDESAQCTCQGTFPSLVLGPQAPANGPHSMRETHNETAKVAMNPSVAQTRHLRRSALCLASPCAGK